MRGNITVETPEEARKAIREKKEQGYDLIKLNEFISFDLVHAAADEAHKVGLPVTAHSWDVIESVKAGVDSIEHIWSVGYSSILDVKRRRQLAEAPAWPATSSRSLRARTTSRTISTK